MNTESFRQLYTNDVDKLLEKIRVNCVLFSKAHKQRYLALEQSLKYYKLPVIVISGVSSLVAVSQEYMPQYYITVINSVFGLCVSVICSVELYLGISVQLSKAAMLTKEFYELSIEIFKVLSMDINNRTENPMTFLESVFGRYSSLYANKDIVKFHIQDQLIPLNDDLAARLRQNSETSNILNQLVSPIRPLPPSPLSISGRTPDVNYI